MVAVRRWLSKPSSVLHAVNHLCNPGFIMPLTSTPEKAYPACNPSVQQFHQLAAARWDAVASL